MKPTKRNDGRWQVRVPRKLTVSGRRETKYFSAKSKAEKFIKDFKSEHREHGKATVTAEERAWIVAVREKLGSLNKLHEVLEHWFATGAVVQPSTVKDAVTNSRSTDSKIS